MVFKWFKARITMNRMPAHSSAVAGSYRTVSMFDAPQNDFIRNNNQTEADGQIKPEPNSIIRPVSAPVFNNPMDRTSKKDLLKPSNKKTAPKPTARSQDGLNRKGSKNETRAENPVLSKTATVQPDVNENIANTTPRPAPKLSKTDYKRKKVKAPAPKLKLNINSAGSTSENRSAEFVTIKDKRKTSQSSDIDV